MADDGVARLRWVAVGERSGGTVEIRAGIEAGERVILDPAGLVEGAPIRETKLTDVAGSAPAEER